MIEKIRLTVNDPPTGFRLEVGKYYAKEAILILPGESVEDAFLREMKAGNVRYEPPDTVKEGIYNLTFENGSGSNAVIIESAQPEQDKSE